MKLFCGSFCIIPSEEMSQFCSSTLGVFANQSHSPETLGVIFATENKCKQIRESTASAGGTNSPVPGKQVVLVGAQWCRSER